MAQTLRKALGVNTVQIAGYSNGYHGYLTTFEEYQVQAYEGAHTVFGQWTLAAYQTVLADLAAILMTSPADRDRVPGPVPARYAEEEVQRRRYVAPPPARSWG